MVNTTVAEYLQKYRDKYDIEELRKEIVSKGYSAQDFDDAAAIVGVKNEEKPKQLPAPVPVKKKKKNRKFNWWAFSLVIIAIFIFGVIGMNYAGYDFFGWNVFNIGA